MDTAPRSGPSCDERGPGRAIATISAILVSGSAPCVASFGLVVVPAGGRTLRAACRQSVPADRCDVHVGAVVPVRVDADRAIRIDWEEPGGTWQPLPGLIVDGVHDDGARAAGRRLRRGSRALARVLGASAGSGRGCDGAVDVEVEVGAGGRAHLVRLRRRNAPFYARHLLRPGAILPAIVDDEDGTVLIDWLSAANGLVARHTPSPDAVLAAFATGGFGATSADAPGLRRPVLRPPGPDGPANQM